MGRHEKTARALASLRRRGVALTGLAMVVAGGIWAAVAWASTEVSFSGINDGTVDVTDVPNNVKETYNIDGRPREIEGDSLQHILNEVDVRSEDWSRLFFDGGVIRNEDEYINDLPPVFYLSKDEEDVIFLIPKKEGQEAQEFRKGLDFFYRAAIDVDPEEVKSEQGETQVFEADVVNGGPQNNYTFNWNASSGESGTGKTFELTFNTSGPVTVNVSARRSGNVVAEGIATAEVKEAPEEDTGSGSGGIDYGSGYGSGYSYTPPADDYDSNFPDYGGSDSPVPDDVKTPDAEPTPLEEAGVSVSGELLSATTPLPPASGDAGETPEEDAPDPDAAIEEAEEINGPGALIAAGVVVGLLGLGAGREMETVRPRRLRRPDLSGLRRLLPPWK